MKKEQIATNIIPLLTGAGVGMLTYIFKESALELLTTHDIAQNLNQGLETTLNAFQFLPEIIAGTYTANKTYEAIKNEFKKTYENLK